jgi:DNA-directed RNA polymerase subunit RPC12/RpoP
MKKPTQNAAWRWYKKVRGRVWFLVIMVVLLALAWLLALQDLTVTELRAVICCQCGHGEIRDIVPGRIHRYRCTRCGGNLGFAWKCTDCDYEFPLVLRAIAPGSMSKKDELEQRMNEWRCPNCRRTDCYQMSLIEFGKGKGK